MVHKITFAKLHSSLQGGLPKASGRYLSDTESGTCRIPLVFHTSPLVVGAKIAAYQEAGTHQGVEGKHR